MLRVRHESNVGEVVGRGTFFCCIDVTAKPELHVRLAVAAPNVSKQHVADVDRVFARCCCDGRRHKIRISWEQIHMPRSRRVGNCVVLFRSDDDVAINMRRARVSIKTDGAGINAYIGHVQGYKARGSMYIQGTCKP